LPSSQKKKIVGSAGAAAGLDPFAEIIALARKAPTRGRLLRDSLWTILRGFGSPYGALHVRYHAEILHEDAHTGATDPSFWKNSVQLFLTESLAENRPRARLLKAKTGTAKAALLSAPIYDVSGPAIGAIALVVELAAETDCPARLATLEALCRLVSFCSEFKGVQGDGNAARAADPAFAKAAECESIEQFAFSITNELCNKLGCVQVAIATAERMGLRIRSISGLDQIGVRTPGVTTLRSAMEECLDAGRTIVCQADGQWAKGPEAVDYRLHKQWHAAAAGDAVASIPLRVGETVAAVLSLRRGKDQPFSREFLDQLAGRLASITPALLLARKAHRGIVRHLIDATFASSDALFAPGRLGRKAVAASLAVGALVFCFGSMQYRVRVPCVVQAAQSRHLSAPFEGVLAATFVTPGDHVKAGQVLAELDHRDLSQQRAELLAQAAVYEREKDRAMAAGSPVELSLASANQKLIEAKLKIIDSRIERAFLRAPFDGVVIHGDLRKRVGDRLMEGEPVFQIASPTGWKLELEIPEHAVGHIQPGLSGRFASFARPEWADAFEIVRVEPAAQLRREKNVFIAEATVRDGGNWVRPGMEGVARVEIGARPIRWVALHRVIEYLRLRLWL
jgi:multidrug efflux pump subunit AcrA (membrane-fusion protein)